MDADPFPPLIALPQADSCENGGAVRSADPQLHPSDSGGCIGPGLRGGGSDGCDRLQVGAGAGEQPRR